MTKDDLAVEGEFSRKAKHRLRMTIKRQMKRLSRTISSISRPEFVDGEEQGRCNTGLEMMSAEFGWGSDMDKSGDEEDISDGELDDDLGDDDFYSQIKKENNAKKEY